ncbi:MAG: ATP-binding protein [Candidatus Omnitrophota bacterium]
MVISIRRFFADFLMVYLPWMLSSAPVSAASVELTPLDKESHFSETWEYVSFLKDAGLTYRSIYFIDFDRHGVVWIAASDGLYSYDGYGWKRYTKQNGLPSNFIRCVRIVRDGTLWVGTDQGAGTFDGKRYDAHGSETGLAGPSVRRIVEDPDGSLWFCCDRWPEYNVQGGLSRYADGRWTVYRRENGFPSDYVIDYFRDSQNRQFVMTGNRGLVQQESDRWFYPLSSFGLHKDENLWCAAESPVDGVMIASFEGAYVWKNGQWRFFSNPSNLTPLPNQRVHQLCTSRDGRILSFNKASGEQFMYLLEWREDHFEPITSMPYPGDQWVETVAEAPDGSIWCGGKNLLLRWTKRQKEWMTFKEFPEPHFYDNRGRTWFVGKDAIIRSASGGWEPWEQTKGLFFQDGAGGVWRWSESQLTRWHKEGETQYGAQGMTLKTIDGVIPDAENRIWFYGKKEEGKLGIDLFAEEKWMAIDVAGFENRRIIDICSDPKEGVWLLLSTDQASLFQLVRLSPSGKNPKFVDIDFPMIIPPKIFVDHTGTIWLYGSNILYFRQPDQNQEWTRENKTVGGVILGVYENVHGLWFVCDCGSYGLSGISRLKDGVWDNIWDQIVFTAKNPDGSIVFVGYDTIYVSSVFVKESYRITLPRHGYISGAVLESTGVLWIRIDSDVYRFSSDRIPPETILSPDSGPFYHGDNIVCGLTAIEFGLPRGIHRNFRYSMRLDSEPWPLFSHLPDIFIDTRTMAVGKHSLEVRARDEGLDVDPTPARWEFAILPKPLQEREWFTFAVSGIIVLIVSLAAAASILALIAVRTRNQAQQERKALQWISQKLAGSLTAKEIARLAAEESQRIFHHDAFFLDIFNPSKTHLLGIYNEDTPPDGKKPVEVPSTTFDIQSIENKYSINLKVLLGETVLINRPSEAKTSSFLPFGYKDRLSRSLMFVPLVWENETIGSLSVQSYTPGRYKEKDLSLLKSFADNCSGALARVRAEEALKQSEEQLQQSQKMEAVGRLAGGIAHDFNNLLMAIIGYGDLALKKLDANASQRKYIEEMIKAGNRAAALTQQLLAFSRKQIVQPKVFNPNTIIYDMNKMLQRLIGEDIEVVMDLDPSLGCVKADPGQIEQVIVNLFVNARDAMLQGGRLTILTRNIDFLDIRATERLSLPPGPYVLLFIEDTGHGIEKSIQEKIFEPFFTTKEINKGAGLGLSTVYGIVKQSGGAIAVDSEPGKGSAFSIYLPRVDSLPDAIQKDPPSPKSSRGAETILLAEDQELVRDLAARALRENGYAVLEAANGAEAVQLHEQFKDVIHLLLTDVIMPGMSGRELSKRITAQRPEIRTIYISGYSEDVISHHGVLEPGTTLLKKPFANDVMLQEIRKVLDKSE